MEAELKEVKNDEESLTVTLNDYQVAMNNAENKLDPGELKNLALVLELKRMEHEQTDVWAETEMLHKTTNEVITNTMSETPKRSKLTDLIVSAVNLDLSGFQGR